MNQLTFISLFAGIGGIDLGLERAGMQCAAQVEIDEYATRVLAKHWPNVLRHRDVRTVGVHNLPRVDVIAGGFPCQDISNAGRRAGIDGERSGLWSEYARIICELRPRYVLVENVAALLYRGLDRVLGDLASIGYDAEWSMLSACALGAPHTRERVFIVAYPHSNRRQRGRLCESWQRRDESSNQSTRQIQSDLWQADHDQICGMADGLSGRLDKGRRLKGLGNAVVPQAAEFVGRLIVEHARAI